MLFFLAHTYKVGKKKRIENIYNVCFHKERRFYLHIILIYNKED